MHKKMLSGKAGVINDLASNPCDVTSDIDPKLISNSSKKKVKRREKYNIRYKKGRLNSTLGYLCFKPKANKIKGKTELKSIERENVGPIRFTSK